MECASCSQELILYYQKSRYTYLLTRMSRFYCKIIFCEAFDVSKSQTDWEGLTGWIPVLALMEGQTDCVGSVRREGKCVRLQRESLGLSLWSLPPMPKSVFRINRLKNASKTLLWSLEIVGIWHDRRSCICGWDFEDGILQRSFSSPGLI